MHVVSSVQIGGKLFGMPNALSRKTHYGVMTELHHVCNLIQLVAIRNFARGHKQ